MESCIDHGLCGWYLAVPMADTGLWMRDGAPFTDPFIVDVVWLCEDNAPSGYCNSPGIVRPVIQAYLSTAHCAPCQKNNCEYFIITKDNNKCGNVPADKTTSELVLPALVRCSPIKAPSNYRCPASFNPCCYHNARPVSVFLFFLHSFNLYFLLYLTRECNLRMEIKFRKECCRFFSR